MEEDGIQAQACKFPRIENGTARNDSSNNNTKIGSSINEENGDLLRKRSGGGGGGGGDGSSHRFHSWHHHSSRIIRVSRASGGKDRHSKVMTSKGLRDRRVRLSVTTAIQFYDLQDRLGYDQPSKAVEWLIKAASDAISELPSLNNTFPETPKQPSDEKRGGEKCGIGSADAEEDGEASFHHHHHHHHQNQNQNQSQNQSQNLSLSKSACSSTSETSKGSGGLSLSRSEIRVKARERARERAAKEKEKENDESCNNNNNIGHHPHNNNNIVMSMAQTSSFTELLTGVPAATTGPTGSGHHHHHHHHHRSDEADLFSKGARHQWNIAPMDYFGAGILGGSSSTSASRTGQHHHQSSGFSGQIQLGNNLAHAMSVAPPFVVQSENQHSDQLQHFSFITDHLMPAGVVTSTSSASQASSGGGGGSSEYNLNFTISSSNSGGLAGFNSRGTLQSNSPSLLPHHLQRFSPLDGSSNLPFFIGAAAAAAAAPAMENHHHHQHHQHHQFSPELDGRLQLCYGDGSQHSDQKGKGKN